MSENSENDNNGGGEVTALHDLIAGGIAGSASVVVGHPFDTIKVRLQTSMAAASGSSKASQGAVASFQGLFKGMAAPLSTAAVVNAIIFATYGSCTRMWERVFEDGKDEESAHGIMSGEGAVFIERGGHHEFHEQMKKGWNSSDNHTMFQEGDHKQSTSLLQSDTLQQSAEQADANIIENEPLEMSKGSSSENNSVSLQPQNTLKVFTCGCAAGTVQAFVICPMEHIKCRLQVQSSAITYKGPIDCCTSIVKNYGLFSGLYRGMGVTLWRETPAFGMYFATYDTIKDQVEKLLEEKDEDHPIPSHAHAWAASALAGGISGAWTWAIIYPFDVIKSQIQTSPLEKHLQKGMVTVARDIVQEHGWRRMFRGLGVTLARAFPVNAIIFPVYEFILVQLGDGD